MENIEFLKNFITEDLYIIKENDDSVKTPAKEEQIPIISEQTSIVSEPEIEILKKDTIPESVFPPYKGGFKKKIIIGVNYNEDKFIAETDLALLLKILGAVNLSIDDVAIINQNNNLISIDELKTWEVSSVIIFDDNSNLIPSLKPYTMEVHHNCKVLLSNPLFSIMSNKEQKQLLWTALQSMFLK